METLIYSLQAQFEEGHTSQAWEFWLPPANTFILATHTNFMVRSNSMFVKPKQNKTITNTFILGTHTNFMVRSNSPQYFKNN